MTEDLPKFQVGDLIRSLDDSNANTVYRVLKVKSLKKHQGYSFGNMWDYTVIGVFGLFKSEFKLRKKIRDHGYEKVTLLELARCRNSLDLFIQREAKRLAGE